MRNRLETLTRPVRSMVESTGEAVQSASRSTRGRWPSWTALAVVGLAFAGAAYYFGPELLRYIKAERM